MGHGTWIHTGWHLFVNHKLSIELIDTLYEKIDLLMVFSESFEDAKIRDCETVLSLLYDGVGQALCSYHLPPQEVTQIEKTEEEFMQSESTQTLIGILEANDLKLEKDFEFIKTITFSHG